MNSTVSADSSRVAVLIDRLARITREIQFVEGLNPAQWEALRFVARANRYSRTPSALAEFLGATKGTASQTLIALEQKGYVRRVRSEVDRRQIDLTLTDSGRELLAKDPIRGVEQAADQIPGETSSTLVDGLTQLLDGLRSRHAIKEFGVCRQCNMLRTDEKHMQQCGVTGEPLSNGDVDHICINYESAGVAQAALSGAR